MSHNQKLKEAFAVESKYGAFYTGGHVEWHDDRIYCQTLSSISLLDVNDGTIRSTIGDPFSETADLLYTFTVNGETIVSSHKSGLLKLWTNDGKLLKMWKSIHQGPISKLHLDGDLLISGGADGVVRLWDLKHQACVAVLKQCQGVVNVIEVDPQKLVIVASGDDGKVHSWNLSDGNFRLSYNEHYSKVTSLVFANDNEHFVTAGRDKVIILWKLGDKAALKTIAVYESLEVIVGLPQKFKLPDFKSQTGGIYVASGGENGLVRVWDVTNAKEIFKQDVSVLSSTETRTLTHLLLNGKTLAVVNVDHNIILYYLKSFACNKQFVGFSDNILDVTYMGTDDSHLAVATNSCDIKLYENSTMSCQLLKGHTDIVLALTTSKTNPNLLASTGKDNKIRLWLLQDNLITCVGLGSRHTATVTSVAFANATSKFLVSVSHDCCLKFWTLPAKLKQNTNLECSQTEIAHQKDINHVTVAPNDRMIATASQDKTAKLWDDNLTLIGVFKGHKRGVWCVKFSPVDQVLLTSSADCSIKLWSVTDLSCLKTLEGHESSVLRVEFLSNGMQVLSTGSDGFLKLFNIKTSECVATFDEHQDRVWALAVKDNESQIVTGGADSLLIKWNDVSEERRLQRTQKEEEQVLDLQKLANYIQNNQLLKALKLALKLDRPLQVLRLIEKILLDNEFAGLNNTVKELKPAQKERLLDCVTNWNTNSKNSHCAQLVLNILLGEIQSGDFQPSMLTSTLEGTLPYTERHFDRFTKLIQNLHLITYSVNCIQPHAKPV